MASCRKWILNIHSFTIWIKNEQLPVDHTFWWPILRKKFHEIFTLVWEAISKTRASGFIRGSKHLETIKALGRSGLVLSSVSRCLEPLIKPSHSLLIYYINFMQVALYRCFDRLLGSWIINDWYIFWPLKCMGQLSLNSHRRHNVRPVYAHDIFCNYMSYKCCINNAVII